MDFGPRGAWRSTALLVPVAVLALTAGCRDSAEAEADAPSTNDAPAATAPAGSQSTATAPVPEPGTRAAAQRALRQAEKALLAAPSGRYEVEWYADGTNETIARADFDGAVPASRVVLSYEGNTLDVRRIRRDMWVLKALPGQGVECYSGSPAQNEAQARINAIPPGIYPLIEPRAVGFARGTATKEIVVRVLLDEAVPIAAPRLASQLQPIDPEASVPGVVALKDGRYAALTFDMADVVEELERSGKSVPGVLHQALDLANGAWPVRVSYLDLGGDVSVRPPGDAARCQAG